MVLNSDNLPPSSADLLCPNSSSHASGCSFSPGKYTDLTDHYRRSLHDSGIKISLYNDPDTIKRMLSDVPVNHAQHDNIHTTSIYRSEKIITLDNNKLSINPADCRHVTQLVISGFPLGQYILNMNGINVMTARGDGEYYVFDLLKSSSSTLKALSHDKGFDLTRIDNLYIVSSIKRKNLSNDHCKMYTIGFYPQLNSEKPYGLVETNVYPNSTKLPQSIVHDVYQLYLYPHRHQYQHMAYGLTSNEVKIIIDGVESNKVCVSFKNPYVLVRFSNNKQCYPSCVHRYLDNDIISKTLSFSRIKDVQLVYKHKQNMDIA